MALTRKGWGVAVVAVVKMMDDSLWKLENFFLRCLLTTILAKLLIGEWLMDLCLRICHVCVVHLQCLIARNIRICRPLHDCEIEHRGTYVNFDAKYSVVWLVHLLGTFSFMYFVVVA